MRDYVELANSIGTKLSITQQREMVCDALLEDLRDLKGRDLAPYLLECTFDVVEPGTRFVLKFPMGSHIPDSFIGQVKKDGV